MRRGLTISVVDPDDDYLGLEISAASGRFAGATRIFAALDELGEFAVAIRGFPLDAGDSRRFEFGSRDPKHAGGFVELTFRCVDGTGHAEVHVAITDDDQFHSEASSQFSFPIHAAALDRFVQALCGVESAKAGEATLAAAV